MWQSCRSPTPLSSPSGQRGHGGRSSPAAARDGPHRRWIAAPAQVPARCPSGMRDPTRHVTSGYVVKAAELRSRVCRRPQTPFYFFGASTVTINASVKVSSTLSPAFRPSSFFLSST